MRSVFCQQAEEGACNQHVSSDIYLLLGSTAVPLSSGQRGRDWIDNILKLSSLGVLAFFLNQSFWEKTGWQSCMLLYVMILILLIDTIILILITLTTPKRVNYKYKYVLAVFATYQVL